MDDVGRGDAQQHDGRGAAHKRDAAVLEGRDEARAHLQTDREDEEDQSELLHEVAYAVVDCHAEVAQEDADEENPGDTERDAADLDLAEQDAEGDHQREREHRVGDAVTEEEGM